MAPKNDGSHRYKRGTYVCYNNIYVYKPPHLHLLLYERFDVIFVHFCLLK